jgi:hypothetical protein
MRRKFVAPSGSLPPWTGDEMAMLHWLEPQLNGRLHTIHNQELRVGGSEWLEEARKFECMMPYERAKASAQAGNIEPLREYLAEQHNDPHLKRFINLPELTVGQNWRRGVTRAERPSKIIAEWARVIRTIWRDHFGRKRRTSGDWTAEEFAWTLLYKSVIGKWPNPLREPYPDDPDEQRWSDRAAEQNRRGK